MQIFALFGQYGFCLTINQWDINRAVRVLFSFRIWFGDMLDPWFHYSWSAVHGCLEFHLGHGKLKSTWVARGPLRRIA